MSRSELHRIVDELPEEQIDAAAELLDAYRRGDRLLVQLLLAPEDDATPDEIGHLKRLIEIPIARRTAQTRLGSVWALRATAREVDPSQQASL